MAETVASLKKEVTKLEKDLAASKKQTVAEKAKATASAKELAILEARMEHQPRALEVLDNLTIAGEGDRSAFHQSVGAAREFLDKLPADLQKSFRDWHPNVRGGSI